MILMVLVAIPTTEGLMATLWKDTEQIRHWMLKRHCNAFRTKYDVVKDQLLEISCSDDLLSGK